MRAQQPVVRSGEDAGRKDRSEEASSAQPYLYPPSYDECMTSGKPVITRRDIYRDGWTDLNKNGRKDPYEDASVPVNDRVENLLSQMTVGEKTAQMATLYGYKRVLKDPLPTAEWRTALWKDGIGNMDEQLNGFFYYMDRSLPGMEWVWPASKHTWALNEIQRFFIEDTRLGIPVDFTDEGIRGIEQLKATCFPTPLAMGATWNRERVRELGEITGREAYALGYSNVYAPILDVLRDPRWGRCEEVYGECPFLVSELGLAMARALQEQGVASTPKHFAVYSNNRGAREGYSRVDPQCGAREAEMIHLWPFERASREAGVLGMMCSYNDVDGVVVEGSSYFLGDLLRKRMQFQGYVVSDSDAVEYLHSKHRVAKDYPDAVRQAVLAGLNVRTTFSPPDVFVGPLREQIAAGALSMEVIDSRVRDILRVKFRLGLFDKPYRPLKSADDTVLSEKHRDSALKASRESLILLKNDKNALPWDRRALRRVAVVGPNADDRNWALQHYGPLDVDVITVRKGLEQALRGQAEVVYAKGCDFIDHRWPDTEIMPEPPDGKEQRMLDEAVELARTADAVVVVVGDTPRGSPAPADQATVGENTSRTGISLPGHQDLLIRAIAKLGKPWVVVNISGRPTALNWADRLCPAIIQAFFPGMFGGQAIAEALLGDLNPGGKLPCTVPKTAGQLEMNFPAKPAANSEGGPGVKGLLWPFGHGLSYTSFEYSDLSIEPRIVKPGGAVTVKFRLKNTGAVAGDEVPQLYVRYPVCPVTVYERQLRGFDRVSLKPGESRMVEMQVPTSHLFYCDLNMRRVIQPGAYQVEIGASLVNTKLKGSFQLEAAAPTPMD